MGTVKTKDSTNAGRRKFLKTAGTVVAILVLASLPLTMSAQDTAGKGRMKIRITDRDASAARSARSG
jgi:hypothetical protein